MKKRKQSRLPEGWTQKDVEEVCEYYDNQSEDEQAAEIEAAFGGKDEALMTVPRPLVPQVRKLIANHRAKQKGKSRKPRKVA